MWGRHEEVTMDGPDTTFTVAHCTGCTDVMVLVGYRGASGATVEEALREVLSAS